MIAVKGHELGVLEMFILALVEATSVNTLYLMRRKAALEPGAIRSAVQSLEAKGLISRSEPAKRRRRTFSVTSRGQSLLKESWSSCVKDHPSPDAVLRAAMVAWWAKGPKLAVEYLGNTGALRLAQSRYLELEAAHLEHSQSDPLSAYSWMRAISEAHRRRAEADAFLSISESLQE